MSVAITEEMLSQLDPAVQAALRQQLEMPKPAALPNAVETQMAAITKGVKRAGFLSHLNFTDVPDEGYAPLPEDISYEGQVVKVEEKTSSNNNDMLSLQIKILLPTQYAGRRVFDNILPTHTGDFPRKKTKSFFRACGMLHEAPGECWITCSDPQDLVDEAVGFRIKNEEYNGNVNPKVAGLYSAVEEFGELEK